MKQTLNNIIEINKKNNGYVGADDSVRPLQKRNTQRGITLVALVITIIVLLILAMVSIKIVMDGGLISKAKESTSQHTIAAEKETIQTGYAAYQIELAQKGTAELKVEGEATVTSKGEDWNVKFAKTNNEYELKKDGTITLKKQGNGSTATVGWTDNGNDTFTKGEVTVKVGDKVTYNVGEEKSTTVTAIKSGDSSDQTFKTEKYLGWRVLGISAKGELELISDNPISSSLYLRGETGYLNAEDVLNNMCKKLYGQGEHATGARSLNVEDINKLGNYDPTTYSGYGDIWTYRFPTNGDYMQYKRTKSDGTLVTDWTDITNTDYQTFTMPGEAETISADNRNDTGRSLENTYYSYKVSDKVKQTTSDGKKMSDIISNGTESRSIEQWLASRCVGCDNRRASFMVNNVSSTVNLDYGYYSGVYHSYGYSSNAHLCVRPVVSLESDIQLSGNSNDGWTIN